MHHKSRFNSIIQFFAGKKKSVRIGGLFIYVLLTQHYLHLQGVTFSICVGANVRILKMVPPILMNSHSNGSHLSPLGPSKFSFEYFLLRIQGPRLNNHLTFVFVAFFMPLKHSFFLLKPLVTRMLHKA